MRIAHEWLQKHPTPAADDGDFHWWPAAEDAAVRATIAAEASGDLTLWLDPARVVVARRFTAIAPADQRRYQGLAVVLADGEATDELLAALQDPAPAPWGVAVPCTATASVAVPCTAAAVAAMWRGGSVRELAVADAARIEAWLPEEIRARPRRVVVGAPDDELGALGPVARWLARAIEARGPARVRAQRAWRAVQVLARVESRGVAAQVAELGALDAAWATAAGVRAYLEAAGIVLAARLHVAGDGRDQWARALHGWGRGWVAGDLAAVLARRGVADHLGGAPAHRWRRILRYEALVAAVRADELERETSTRVPPLAEDADG